MGDLQRRTLISLLRITSAGFSILAASAPANADNWWPSRQFAHPENADDYANGEVYREFLLAWWDEKDGGYTDVYYKPRDAFFNGKKLTRTYKKMPGGTYARIWGDRGKYFKRVVLYKKGAPYVTQIPHFDGDTASWQSFTARRPLPITGKLKVTVDVYMKTRGERGQWKCSVYYKDVCRWDPGRPAIPLHKDRTVTKRWKVSTTIGPDRFASVANSLGLGWWSGEASSIPAEFTNNPILPVVYKGYNACGVGPNNICGQVRDNEETVTKAKIGD